MNFFNLFGNSTSSSGDAGDASYTNSPLLGAYRDLTYEECRDIYRFWPLGKRIANALPGFAMSAQRRFVVKNAPQEVNNKLQEAASELGLDESVKQCAVYARVFGLSSIYVASEVGGGEALTYKDIQEHGFALNVLDPLAMGGSIQVDNDPLSPTFNQPVALRIRGQKIHSARIKVVYNDIPLYYKFNPSSFAFSGPSIYQNMTLLIRAWNRAVVALQRIATKAASLIKTSKETANITGLALTAARKNLELIRSMENDGIASIRSGDTIEFFQLSGVQEVDTILQQLNTALMMALSDTPSGILLDKNLSVGLNDGSEDMKAILMAVDNFRVHVLKPLYVFVDKFLCYKAWDVDFVKEMIEEFPDLYRGKSANEVLAGWMKDYSFEWGELYPQSDNEKTDTASKELDNLTKIKELGANLDCIEDALNQLNLYNTEFILDQENLAPAEGGFDDGNDPGSGELADSRDEG